MPLKEAHDIEVAADMGQLGKLRPVGNRPTAAFTGDSVPHTPLEELE